MNVGLVFKEQHQNHIHEGRRRDGTGGDGGREGGDGGSG